MVTHAYHAALGREAQGFPRPVMVRYWQGWISSRNGRGLTATVVLHGWRPAYVSLGSYPSKRPQIQWSAGR